MSIDKNQNAESEAIKLWMQVRHARHVRGLTLKVCAELSSSSESQLSKVERGLVMPSIALLHRLARVFETNVSDCCATFSKVLSLCYVAAPGTWPRLAPVPAGIRLERMDNAASGTLLQAHIHLVPPWARSDGLIEHPGEEVSYLLKEKAKSCLLWVRSSTGSTRAMVLIFRAMFPMATPTTARKKRKSTG